MEWSGSRRHFLQTSLLASALLSPLVSQTSLFAQQTKQSKAATQYQDSPKGDQRCDNCVFFQPPKSCQVVEGNISPQGWCNLWAKKPS